MTSGRPQGGSTGHDHEHDNHLTPLFSRYATMTRVMGAVTRVVMLYIQKNHPYSKLARKVLRGVLYPRGSRKWKRENKSEELWAWPSIFPTRAFRKPSTSTRVQTIRYTEIDSETIEFRHFVELKYRIPEQFAPRFHFATEQKPGQPRNSRWMT